MAQLSTKTAYGPPETPPSPSDAKMVNVLARHGSRHSGHIAELNDLASRLQLNWTYPADASEASLLLDRGRREMAGLGRRLVAAHPRAFEQMSVVASEKSRCVESARAFLGGAGLESAVATRPVDRDFLLRFFDNCGFKKTPIPAYDTYVARHNLTNDALLAYEGCAYDVLLEQTPTWCWMDLAKLERAKDIKMFYGYASGLATFAASYLLVDFFDAFDRRTTKLRFAHDSTLACFLGLLGVLDDSFQTSRVLPMAANLVATLHESDDRVLVKFALNERDLLLPACQGRLYCPLDTLKAAYAPYLQFRPTTPNGADVCDFARRLHAHVRGGEELRRRRR